MHHGDVILPDSVQYWRQFHAVPIWCGLVDNLANLVCLRYLAFVYLC